MITIVSITKNDYEGVIKTILSTRKYRSEYNFQQIIVDSSTEQIKERIITFIKTEQNIEYFWIAPNGISNAFNFGLSKSKHEWVWFLNGGDSVHPTFPHSILPELVKRASADFLIFQLEYSDSKIIPAFPPIWLNWPPISLWVPHPSMIIRKNIFEKFGNFDVRFKLAMDYDFWLRSFSKNTKLDFISIPLTLYDENGISSVQKKQVAREFLKITFYRSTLLIKTFLIKQIINTRILLRMLIKSLP